MDDSLATATIDFYNPDAPLCVCVCAVQEVEGNICVVKCHPFVEPVQPVATRSSFTYNGSVVDRQGLQTVQVSSLGTLSHGPRSLGHLVLDLVDLTSRANCDRRTNEHRQTVSFLLTTSPSYRLIL